MPVARTAKRLHGAPRPGLSEARTWIGSRVTDSFGRSLGRLDEIWVDAESGQPAWLLIREGRFGLGGNRLVPFEGAAAGGGHVWLPFARPVVRSSPAIGSEEVLTASLGARLRAHYFSAPRADRARARSSPSRTAS